MIIDGDIDDGGGLPVLLLRLRTPGPKRQTEMAREYHIF